MRKVWYPIILIFLLTGCKTTFKSNFRDFNAYYNTYYNAKLSYNRGLKKSLEQARTYNTLQPIRIYETPKGAGAPDFNNAIEKGASVLRKYEDTKWVDNALEIIGKSYFYRSEYFNAIQKFEELYITADDPELKQRSIYWKGRVLLELRAYGEGIQFLNEQLSLNDGEWKAKLEWQVKTVLAEHYVASENWVNALDLLNESVGRIPDRANKERGYFLVGQLNERLGNTEEAFTAYDRVGKFYSNYDLQFAAKKKKAEVARDLGDIDEAIKVFSGMVRDDKNTEFVSELNYELGKSEQIKGNAEKARDIYISILRDPINKPDNDVRALTYNGLAELYRFDFDNYTLAAAYYDSSAGMNIPVDQLPEGYNARELADSFGAYATIKYQIHEQDSLLWLGTLSQEAFDSVLSEIEARKLAELERLKEEQEERRNTLVNVGAGQSQESTSNVNNGFLNIRNPVLIAEATERFQAYWGARPLVNNWRVNSLIINAVLDDSTQTIDGNLISGSESTTIDLSIDLSRIPFTAVDQDSVRELISNLQYELGNIFFLQLDLPDSAAYYFNKLLVERPGSSVVPVTLYSLSELYDIQGDLDSSVQYANELIDNFPETEFAFRLTEKFGFEIQDGITYTEANPRDLYLDLVSSSSVSSIEKAESLANLAIEFKEESFSERALFESIQEYIHLAKSDSAFSNNFEEWQFANDEWEEAQSSLNNKQDSIRTAFQDTSSFISETDSLYFETILDSVLTKPDLSGIFPYSGEYWDSTRAKIDLFNLTFTNSEFTSRVRTLSSEFQVLTVAEEEILPEPEVVEPVINTEESSEYISCSEIRINPEIRGGIEAFNEVLNLTEIPEDEQIVFLFYINTRGIIDEFKLASETQDEDLIQAYVQAIDNYLTFEPVLVNGVASMVSCEIEFRIPN